MEILSIVELILGVLFGGGVLALLQWLYTRKSEKKIAKENAEQADIQTQEKQIDLGSKYLEQVYEIVQKSLAFNEQNSIQNSHLLDDVRNLTSSIGKLQDNITNMESELKPIKENVSDIIEYLDGDFNTWLKNKSKQE